MTNPFIQQSLLLQNDQIAPLNYSEMEKCKSPKKKKSKNSSFNNEDNSLSPSKRSRRNWTDEEETRFLQALELYGRDWHQCAEYMQTRDVVSCRSHAQKVFIKLWINREPLPRKVAEQGAGYTVSGKPLDPESSFVKYYLTLFDKRRLSQPFNSSMYEEQNQNNNNVNIY